MRKNVFSRVLLTCIFVLSILISFAQNRTLTGTVLDEKGVTLPGATVTVKNSKVTTTTDANGKFSLKAPSGSKSLIVSFVGMQDQDVTIGSKSSYFVSMKQGGVILGDVVVIGYGTQKRGDVNGAVSSVSCRDIADIPRPSVDQMLQGKAAGITVTQNTGAPGAAVSVHIRGITPFGGSEPLYVIDGVAIHGNATNGHQLTNPASPSEQVRAEPINSMPWAYGSRPA